ncbi:NAD(P)/FAD-dependent oxidoreductase [Rhodothermus bifroesti]|uniref:NAD(P)/FAD-dependent oxidoreductase n=1 Tax=Rhodothermus bifroesti TaxID=2823335 RepID=UPI000CBB1E01|nr:FAD-dependent oxidoreductase [Rhodothermus bifroesti]GBD02314.1 D-amino acid dehydrogenase [bacterium HR18]
MPSVVIVGGGAIGLASAFFLHQAGVGSITVLERGAIGNGCSYGNAGLVSPSHVIPLAAPGVMRKGLRWLLNSRSPFYIRPRWDLDLFRWLWHFGRSATARHVQRNAPVLKALLERSRTLTAMLQEKIGDFGYRSDGLLMVFQDEGYAECAALAQEAARLGMSCEWVTKDRLIELAGTRVQAQGGLFFPGDAHLQPDRFTAALASFLTQHGVCCQSEVTVTEIVRQGRRVRGLKTTAGFFEADVVVLATGAWSVELAQMVGYRLPLQPAKGYSLTFTPPPEGMPQRPLLLTEAKVAVTPFSDALRLAGTLELAGIEQTIRPHRVEAIYRAAQQYLPMLRWPVLETAKVWSGLRPCTPDGLPVVDWVPGSSNLLLATGHAMLGISLAAVTGELVAALVAGKQPELDITPLRGDRWG